MPFPKDQPDTPTQVGRVLIELADIPGRREFRYTLELNDDTGRTIRTQSGNLAPHLTANQLTALNNFMDAMRTKASEALP